MSCRICGKPVSDGVYCRKHERAYTNLEEGYQKWRYALGTSWPEYLEKVAKASGSGKWVKEVVKDILKTE